ncbi:hypothetical protein BKA69DRAFT_442960 [Paraphysoderma sedebokerense]|nr:hypothetical protein BKA69DRAFT_442960 [Paraphysoderma sedebokerense]
MAVKCHRLEKVGAEKVETEVNNDESATAAFPQRDKQSKERNAHPISRLNTIMPSPPNPSIVYQTESALKRKYAVNKPIDDVAAQRREKASKGIAQDVTFGRSESFAVCPDNKSIIAPPDDVNLHENGATRQRYSRSDQSQKSNDQRIHRTGDNSLICQSDNEVRRKPKKSDSSQSVDNPFRQSTEATHDVFLEKLKGCDSDSQDSLQESIATDYSEDIVDKSNDRNPKQRSKGGHKESYSLSSDIGTSESDHSVRDQEYDYPESQSSPSQCIVSESEDEDDEYVPSQNEKQRSKRHSRNSQRSRNGISSAKTSEKASNKKTNKEYMNNENHEESTEKGISSRNPKSKFNNNSPKSREQPKNGIVSFGQLLAHLSNSAKKKAIRETTETNDAEVSESENMRSLKRYYDQTDPADGEIYSERNAKVRSAIYFSSDFIRLTRGYRNPRGALLDTSIPITFAITAKCLLRARQVYLVIWREELWK